MYGVFHINEFPSSADFAWMHHSIGRGDDNRNLQMCDWMVVELSRVGPTTCLALVAVNKQGKTNRVGNACSMYINHSSLWYVHTEWAHRLSRGRSEQECPGVPSGGICQVDGVQFRHQEESFSKSAC